VAGGALPYIVKNLIFLKNSKFLGKNREMEEYYDNRHKIIVAERCPSNIKCALHDAYLSEMKKVLKKCIYYSFLKLAES